MSRGKWKKISQRERVKKIRREEHLHLTMWWWVVYHDSKVNKKNRRTGEVPAWIAFREPPMVKGWQRRKAANGPVRANGNRKGVWATCLRVTAVVYACI